MRDIFLNEISTTPGLDKYFLITAGAWGILSACITFKNRHTNDITFHNWENAGLEHNPIPLNLFALNFMRKLMKSYI